MQIYTLNQTYYKHTNTCQKRFNLNILMHICPYNLFFSIVSHVTSKSESFHLVKLLIITKFGMLQGIKLTKLFCLTKWTKQMSLDITWLDYAYSRSEFYWSKAKIIMSNNKSFFRSRGVQSTKCAQLQSNNIAN